MERLRRLRRQAVLRGDRLALLNIEARIAAEWRKVWYPTIVTFDEVHVWTEAELREAWGK